MDHDKIQKLVILCHQIARDGITPAVGTLRGRAPMKVSVTEAIEAMKLYQQSVKLTDTSPEQQEKKPTSSAQRITQLEQRVEALEATLQAIEARLNSAE